MNLAPRALVLNAPGINCNAETAFAVEQAGGQAEQVHIEQLRSGEVSLSDYQMFLLSGGFSYGDDIQSGRLLGLLLRKRFGEDLNDFVAAGKPVVGICNGNQVLVETGLLPDGKVRPVANAAAESIEIAPKTMSLVANANSKFECRWGRLRVESSVCKFIGSELVGQVVEMPSAHQEGRYVTNATDTTTFDKLAAAGQLVFSFVDAEGEPTEQYPENPNGSQRGATGFCDPSGVVLGLMPHPERVVRHTQHPNWRRGEGRNPFGALLFRNIVNYAEGI